MSIAKKLSSLGPGLLWAGAAIGVSHLVQSTRAGAEFGFELVWVILLINLLKYPFFEFGPRYASATGETLLDGYNRLGKWAVYLYVALTLLTMFTLQAAVTAVTAGIYSSVFTGFLPDVKTWIYFLLIALALIVSFGKYSLLDKIIKFIIVLLAISTIIAVVFAAFNGYNPDEQFAKSFSFEFADLALLIAIAGWMPSAVDISVWHSAWTIAKKESSGKELNVKESIFDFNVGYIGTALLSIGFLALGALVMYGTGEQFPANGTEFANRLISLFTSSLGSWSYIFIAVAALSTMTSTVITCLDAYPRVMKPATEIVFPVLKNKKNYLSAIWMFILIAGTSIFVMFFMESMKVMVDLATTISFLTAPILGWLNYKVVMGKNVSDEHKPKKWLRILSFIGLFVLTATSLYFLIWKYFI